MRPTISTAISIILTLGLLACDNLDVIEDEGCGNRVINKDEDCDSSDPFGGTAVCGEPNTPNACFFVCSDDAVCPDGWGCGADDRCRRPGGGFSSVSGDNVALDNFTVGDLDGDGIMDLVGSRGPAVSVRYGDGDGRFQTGFDQALPQTTGALAFGHFSMDPQLDMIVPVLTGFFSLLGTEARTLEPFNYAPFVLPGVMDMMGNPVPPEHGRPLAVNAILEASGTPQAIEALFLLDTGMMLIDFQAPSPMVANVPNVGTAGDLVRALPAADIDNDLGTEVALLYHGGDKVWIYDVEGDTGLVSYPPSPEISMPLGYGIVDPGGLFADVDNDGDLDLVISVALPGTTEGDGEVAVALMDDTGAFDQARLDHPLNNDVCMGDFAGQAHLPLAAADLNGDDLMDYVFAHGIALASGPDTVCPNGYLFASNQPVGGDEWDLVELVDINADGLLDVAVASSETSGVEFLLNNDLAERPIFSRFPLGSSGPTKVLRSGDYDGDLVPDLAFVENGEGRRPDRLLVVYGTYFSGPTQVVDMGGVGVVEDMTSGSTLRGLNGTDVASDLILVTRAFVPPEDTGTEPPLSIAVAFGESSRRMVSPFLSSHTMGTIPAATIIGEFGSPPGSEDNNGTDVALIMVSQNPGDVQPPPPDYVVMAAGMGEYGDVFSPFHFLARLPMRSMFDSSCALWTSGALGPASSGKAALVGVDSGPACGGEPRLLIADQIEPVLMPGSMPPPGPQPEMAMDLPAIITDIPISVTEMQRVALFDLDGDQDQDLDLLLVFTRAEDKSRSVLILWNEMNICGGARFCMAASTEIRVWELESTSFSSILDAAPIQLDTDPEPELAILTDRGTIAVELDPAERSYGQQRWLLQLGMESESDEFGSIRTADVNNDGLGDLVINGEGRVRIGLQDGDDAYGYELSEPETDPAEEPMP